MAYRFNPPPNWPLDDPAWSPPPGWQPDPSWGPAPEGWNFWVVAEEPSEPDGTGRADGAAATAGDAAEAPLEGADGRDQGAPAGATAAGAAAPADARTEAPMAEAPTFGQASAAPEYGQATPGYGQASPAPGFGQATPGYGSAADHSGQGHGQGSPGVGPGWAASTGAAEPPRRSILRRFWWVGCLLALLLAVVLVVVGGIVLLVRGSYAETSGAAATGAEQSTVEAAADEASEETVTPTDLATIDPAAEALEVVGTDGAGTMAVDMTYASAADLPRTWGGTVEESRFGEYLVVTAELTVTDGTVELNPFQFTVRTPYGGAVDPSAESYALVGSGLDTGAPTEFTAGDEYTVQILFEVERAGGNVLNFTTYTDDYTWDVPA